MPTGPRRAAGSPAASRSPTSSRWSCWVAWNVLPIPAGLLLKAILDRVAAGPAEPVAGLLVALAVVEVGRWAVFGFAVVQWHGCWVFWNTLPRINMLRSLVQRPGPGGRSAPELQRRGGEPLPRRLHAPVDGPRRVARHDRRRRGRRVGGGGDGRRRRPGHRRRWSSRSRSPSVLCRLLGNRLRAWRRREREATAAVTGFIGDLFGAIGAVKVAGAEAAVARRFEALGEARADAARVDQVATQVLRTSSDRHRQPRHRPGRAARGARPRAGRGHRRRRRPLRRRRQRARQPAALGGQHRRLPPPGRGVGRAHGPPAARPRADGRGGRRRRSRCGTARARSAPRPVTAPDERAGDDALRELTVARAHRHPSPAAVASTTSTSPSPRGSLTAITGPVGAGKSTLLRCLLGLAPLDDGEVRWNGTPVDDPSQVLVPPRAAYVAQVPRLFSEPLSDAILLGVEPDGPRRRRAPRVPRRRRRLDARGPRHRRRRQGRAPLRRSDPAHRRRPRLRPPPRAARDRRHLQRPRRRHRGPHVGAAPRHRRHLHRPRREPPPRRPRARRSGDRARTTAAGSPDRRYDLAACAGSTTTATCTATSPSPTSRWRRPPRRASSSSSPSGATPDQSADYIDIARRHPGTRVRHRRRAPARRQGRPRRHRGAPRRARGGGGGGVRPRLPLRPLAPRRAGRGVRRPDRPRPPARPHPGDPHAGGVARDLRHPRRRGGARPHGVPLLQRRPRRGPPVPRPRGGAVLQRDRQLPVRHRPPRRRPALPAGPPAGGDRQPLPGAGAPPGQEEPARLGGRRGRRRWPP